MRVPPTAARGDCATDRLIERLWREIAEEVCVELADRRLVANAEFLRFAAHWGFRLRACRPYRARTKGKVERPFRYVREDFFLARSFRNLDDLNAQFSQWLDQVVRPP